MNRNTMKSIAIACGLALTLSTIAATSFARGSGHSSRGSGHFGGSFSHRGNFGRSFSSYRYHNFHGHYGWGYYPSYYSYGWGWGCWNSPYAYGNNYSYSGNSYDSNSSYGDNSYGSPTTAVNAPGSPSAPNVPPQDATTAPPTGGPVGPAGNTTAIAAATIPGPAGNQAPANNDQANADVEASTPDAPPTAATTPTAAGQPTDGPKPIVPPAPADPLVGTFKAKPAPDVQIELTMRADTTFTWKFTAGGKTQTFSGLYELAPNSLTLTRDGGEKMDGTLERVGSTGFKFRMKGADAQDPGLTFSL